MELKRICELFLKYNYLPSKEIIDFIIKNKLDINEVEKVLSLSNKLSLDGTLSVIDILKYELLKKQEKNINWDEIEKVRVFLEKNKGDVHFKTILSFFINEKEIENYLSLIKKYKKRLELKLNIKYPQNPQNENLIYNETKSYNFNYDFDKKNRNFLFKKDDIITSDYKNYIDKIKTNDNIFENLIFEDDNLNNENKDEDKKNEENFEEIKDSDKKNDDEIDIDIKIGTKKDKHDEIGEFNDQLLNEIKKKVEVLVNYSPNKVEWVENPLKVIKSVKAKPKKVEVIDFLKYFRSKYKKLKNLLLNRASHIGKDLVSIDSIKNNGEYATIAMVRELEQKDNFLVGIIEDLTGEIKFKVNLKEVKEAIELVPDDVAAFVGRKKGKTFYIEKIIYPDLPNNSVKWLKDYGINEDIYAVVLSDIHVGSKLFLKDRFTKFIEWLNGKNNKYHGKIGYVIISGDLVDGIGVYPEQIEELEIGSGYEQYKTFANFLDLIPSEINIIISPGNHDIIRLAEPQPILPKDVAEPIMELNNAYLVSNPSMVLLKDYIKLLSYHGYSYDFFINELDHLRGYLSYEKIHELMKMLLKKRHLVPSYKAAPIAPEHEDFLVIEDIPNFMTSGHIHYSDVGDYKGIKLLSSSCWQAMTPFQEKVGHNPDPGKIPMINLKDGKVKILQF